MKAVDNLPTAILVKDVDLWCATSLDRDMFSGVMHGAGDEVWARGVV